MSESKENKNQIGMRVGALLSAADGVVEWLGWGNYLGDLPMPGWRELAQDLIPMQRNLIRVNMELSEEELYERTEKLYKAENELQGLEPPTEKEIREQIENIKKDWEIHLSWDDDTMAQWLVEKTSMLRNPCIELEDGGGLVWGFECWWAPEDRLIPKLDKWKEAGWEIRSVKLPPKPSNL